MTGGLLMTITATPPVRDTIDTAGAAKPDADEAEGAAVSCATSCATRAEATDEEEEGDAAGDDMFACCAAKESSGCCVE